MSEAAAKKFADEFVLSSQEFSDQHSKSKAISFGEQSVLLAVNLSTPVGSLIDGAFLPSKDREPNFTLQIWDSSRGNPLPDLGWARSYLQQDIAIPAQITGQFRIAFDKSQGFIYVYDTQTQFGSVWIRDHALVALSSFITPFRLILSWMADHFDGEIVHASAIGINGKGILINGPSGSGKSTLALQAALKGQAVLADDVTLHQKGRIYAVYSRGKAQASSTPLSLAGLSTFNIADTTSGKTVIPLINFGEFFISSLELKVILLPIFAHLNHFEKLQPKVALKLMAPNSLREIFGGTTRNFMRLAQLTRTVPAYRLALSEDLEKNFRDLLRIAEEN